MIWLLSSHVLSSGLLHGNINKSNVKQHVLNKIWDYALQLFLPGHRTAALNNNNFAIGWSGVLIYTICGDIKNTDNFQ